MVSVAANTIVVLVEDGTVREVYANMDLRVIVVEPDLIEAEVEDDDDDDEIYGSQQVSVAMVLPLDDDLLLPRDLKDRVFQAAHS